MTVVHDFTREQLIELCEQALRPQLVWHDRDSAGAQCQLGTCWALLKADCEWRYAEDPEQSADTIWLEVRSKGFMCVETGEEEDMNKDTFYLPTPTRLARAGARDWY